MTLPSTGLMPPVRGLRDVDLAAMSDHEGDGKTEKDEVAALRGASALRRE